MQEILASFVDLNYSLHMLESKPKAKGLKTAQQLTLHN